MSSAVADNPHLLGIEPLQDPAPPRGMRSYFGKLAETDYLAQLYDAVNVDSI